MRQQSSLWQFVTVVPLCCLAVGCGGAPSNTDTKTSENGTTANVEFPEGDPSVSAELGGPEFTGEGWTTNDPGPLGDPTAIKGGVILSNIPAWPGNLRMYGTESNTHLNFLIRDLCYETLCVLDPHTHEFAPGLASHWKISDDKMSSRFVSIPKLTGPTANR